MCLRCATVGWLESCRRSGGFDYYREGSYRTGEGTGCRTAASCALAAPLKMRLQCILAVNAIIGISFQDDLIGSKCDSPVPTLGRRSGYIRMSS